MKELLCQVMNKVISLPLFLQLMDAELMASLRTMSKAGVLTYNVLQFVVEMSANHQALIHKDLRVGVWRLNCLYQREAFKQDIDSVEIQLEDSEVRNKKLLSSLRTSIAKNEDFEQRIVALEHVIEGLRLELHHYKDKKPSFVKQVKRAGSAIIGHFGTNGKSKSQQKRQDEDERTYEVINLG